MAGHRVAGAGQLILAVMGCILGLAWFFKTMYTFYGQISGAPVGFNAAPFGISGALLFVASWLWALYTSIQITRQSRPLPPAISI